MVGEVTSLVLGIQPLNYLEHATQIIAEATPLLKLDSTKRANPISRSLQLIDLRVTAGTGDPGKVQQFCGGSRGRMHVSVGLWRESIMPDSYPGHQELPGAASPIILLPLRLD
ncbi:hypothetical protein ASPNIDRAFT_41272 [Aspergillus niger ATCC 1015]|uniref:Uncharacterized protein n=1 Tax=Aspergillus niger (strain ATCC 1015 / CBS 113.46 / FGSC A1144 / LSHB Ac4 / NCTC 3858a / NRRL 328 / USDA 3528.7) TaxID=380704 RepID=G3Y5E9_ASPNA|nr:hypothetical protein ASPNIDRAFT_41272 [Aspergillus niger ATCC 1015]